MSCDPTEDKQFGEWMDSFSFLSKNVKYLKHQQKIYIFN